MTGSTYASEQYRKVLFTGKNCFSQFMLCYSSALHQARTRYSSNMHPTRLVVVMRTVPGEPGHLTHSEWKEGGKRKQHTRTAGTTPRYLGHCFPHRPCPWHWCYPVLRSIRVRLSSRTAGSSSCSGLSVWKPFSRWRRALFQTCGGGDAISSQNACAAIMAGERLRQRPSECAPVGGVSEPVWRLDESKSKSKSNRIRILRCFSN